MENLAHSAAPTFESVWASLQETNRQMQETDRKMQETDRQLKESDRQRRENERILNEKFAETDRRMRIMQKELGKWGNNQGSFAEEYFFNSFDHGDKTFFRENFDRISKNVKVVLENLEDEYDIVMYNSASVAIIEVKFRAREEHIPQLLRKAETFRILYPYYKDYKIYLGLASMSFHAGVEEDCLARGIALIKQVGDTVMIYDEHLTVW